MDSAMYRRQDVAAEQQRFMTKVYGWMSFALLVTGFVAYEVSASPEVTGFLFGNMIVFYGLLVGELVLVMVLAGLLAKMSAAMATFVFIFYSILNGITFSAIFIIYTTESIASTFLITAGTFGVMSFYGYVTKADLTRVGNILFMALVGLVIASVVNIFMKSETIYWLTTYAGVVIFAGLTAYDTQKIKNMNIIGNEGTGEDRKEAIMGALALYLDFINLFLYLLRLFGRRR